jgi:zinc protease
MNSANTRYLRVRKISAILLVSLLISQAAYSQTAEPRRQQLLNDLRILLWSRPGDQSVLLKLRIHSGAAFDTAGKAGTMALLGDILFPDSSTHEYFTQEIGGRLEVNTDYDAINITLQGRANDYDRIVDILRGALVTTPLTPENVVKVREARIKVLTERKPSAADLANEGIARRLFGSFPYGQPVGGTAATLARIDRADLMFARERFLTANNATLVIIGGVDERRAMRALRQLLGGWTKSNVTVPATFRQPDPPRPNALIVDSPDAKAVEVRVATRGVAYSDPDCFAATVLANVARDRWKALAPEPIRQSFFALLEPHALPGMFVIGATASNPDANRIWGAAKDLLKTLATSPVSSRELEVAKGEAAAQITRALSSPEAMADSWLDMDTYGLQSIAEQSRAVSAISVTDLQRVAARLFRDAPVASVVVGSLKQLEPRDFGDGDLKVIERGSKPEKPPAGSAAPKTAATKPN